MNYPFKHLSAVICAIFTVAILLLFIGNQLIRPSLYSSYNKHPLKQSPHKAIVNNPFTLPGSCTMHTCFDVSRCQDFKIYVYPDDNKTPISSNYWKILWAIKNSTFYTTDPWKACLFVPSLDTLDRDRLSVRFLTNIKNHLYALPYWLKLPYRIDPGKEEPKAQPGQNHLIFIMFSGTYPNYRGSDLLMDFGQAILARASASASELRSDFDISFPLVTTDHPEADRPARYNQFQSERIHRSMLTSFKGKRYVFGIGSETRNSLYHIHNGKNIIIATTCKHQSNWNAYADDRCVGDNTYYDTVSYSNLLQNSTFCLVPRGRRLGSYRFLEVLEVGCIPVMLANDWDLPFSEVIDWKEAVVLADERLLTTLPATLQGISDSQIMKMRKQVRFLWDRYFHSFQAIVKVTLELIHNRIRLRKKEYDLWNSAPGALAFSSTVSISKCAYPFSSLPSSCYNMIHAGFTLIVTVREPFCLTSQQGLSPVIDVFSKSDSLQKIIIVWQCNSVPPSETALSSSLLRVVSISVVSGASFSKDAGSGSTPSPSARFLKTSSIPTLAVWSLELSTHNLTIDHVESAYQLWTQFPDRLIGFNSRQHFWNETTSTWDYLKYSNNAEFFSMLLLNAAVYHKYYHDMYWSHTTPKLRRVVDILATGEDILFNCVVGYITKTSPLMLSIKDNNNLQSTDELQAFMGSSSSNSSDPASILVYRSTALRAFAGQFGMPERPIGVNYNSILGGLSSATLLQTNINNFLPLYPSNYRFVVSRKP